MRHNTHHSIVQAFLGGICLILVFTLPGCGKSDAEVEEEIRVETAALNQQIGILEAGAEDQEAKIEAACERIKTNRNLLDVMLGYPGLTAQQRSALESIRAEAEAALEALGCP